VSRRPARGDRSTLKRSQSCNRVFNPSIPYVRSTYVMFGHNRRRPISEHSRTSDRIDGSRARSAGGPLLLAARVVRVDAPRAAGCPPPSHRLEPCISRSVITEWRMISLVSTRAPTRARETLRRASYAPARAATSKPRRSLRTKSRSAVC
jgi:hypothetical protein